MNHLQNHQIPDIQLLAESWTPQRTLSWAFETFGDSVAISSAFGAEGYARLSFATDLKTLERGFDSLAKFLQG